MSGRWSMRSSARRVMKRRRAGTPSSSSSTEGSLRLGEIQRYHLCAAFDPRRRGVAAWQGTEDLHDGTGDVFGFLRGHLTHGGAKRILTAQHRTLARQRMGDGVKVLAQPLRQRILIDQRQMIAI